MLEPYDGKLSRTVLRREGGGNTADPADYSPLVNRLKGQVIKISPNSTQFVNPMDINANYSEEDNPLSLKADFILSLCELVVGGKEGLLPVEKTVIDRCVHLIYRKYFANPCPENMLSKRQYELVTGRRQKSDVIAYQIRQSFKPGEITAEEANKVGYELAMRFTKGKYAFIVATHTDREHIHNHIIYNSTALDSIRKFRDFLLSGLAVQRLSDLICLEHQLSVIEIKPYRERQKRTLYPPKESNRDRLCGVIDTVLAEKPKDYEDFLQGLEQQGYEVKRGKYTSVKGARQKRFIRFRTLGAGYSEEELKAVISGEAEHHPRQKQKRIVPEQKFQMLVDIQAKLAEGKSMGYARWAKRYNLKEMSKTLIFLQENKIGSIEEMQERIDAATARYHELGDSIKATETRMAEIAVLRTHIVNYARTRPVYDAYRKAGYSKRFLDTHREEITLHKAAKTAFDEAGLKKLPKAKDLSIEYAELLKKKKESYPDYRKARDEMQELMKAQKNVEMFFAEEKSTTEKGQAR